MSAEPTITVKTHREKQVALRWEPGEGPVMEVPYGDKKQASLTYILVRHEQGREPHVSTARGLYVKKDGSTGSRVANIYSNNLDRFPTEVRAAALAALAGVAW